MTRPFPLVHQNKVLDIPNIACFTTITSTLFMMQVLVEVIFKPGAHWPVQASVCLVS